MPSCHKVDIDRECRSRGLTHAREARILSKTLRSELVPQDLGEAASWPSIYSVDEPTHCRLEQQKDQRHKIGRPLCRSVQEL